MKAILRYRLPTHDRGVIVLHEGAHLLSVQAVDGEATLWALVDDSKPAQRVQFRVVRDGASAEDLDGVKYLGTACFQPGDFALHYFVVLDRALRLHELVPVSDFGDEDSVTP